MTLTRIRRPSLHTAALAAALALTACSSGGSDVAADANGSLSVSLTDAPVTDVGEIWVEITKLRLKPSGGPAIEFPFDPARQVDLLTLTEDNAETLLDGEPVPAGDYEWLELDVNADFDNTLDSYVSTLVGGQVELRVPSGTVKLVSGFTVTADQETSFLIDWDTRLGLTAPPGQDGYILRPAFRVIDMTAFGTLSGTVALTTFVDDPACAEDDPTLDVGNAVYIYAGAGIEPDDIDGTDPDPVATATVEQNTAGDYVYGTILTPGDYTVAFTCRSGLDDPASDDAITLSTPTDITIIADQEETVDF